MLSGEYCFAKNIFQDVQIELKNFVVQKVNVEKKYSLKELTTLALQQNKNLEAALLEWKNALHQVKVAKSWSNPEVMYSYFGTEVETRVGPQEQSFSLMQKMPFPGKLSTKGNVFYQKALQKKSVYQHKKWMLLFEVENVFYEYVYLLNVIEVTAFNQKLLKDLERVAQIKYKSGITKTQDLLKVQVELGKIANDYTSLKDYQKVIVAQLKALLNWPSNQTLRINTDTSQMNPLTEIPSIAKWEERSPELQGLESAIKQGESQKKLARLDYFPDFSFGVTYIDTNTRSVAVEDNGKDPLIAKVTVSLPIWFNKLKENKNAADTWKDFQQSLYEDKKNIIKVQIETILYQIGDARRKIQLYKSALIPKAQQTLKIMTTNYQTSDASFLDLLDSQRLLLTFQTAHDRSYANYFQNVAKLRALIGGFHNES